MFYYLSYNLFTITYLSYVMDPRLVRCPSSLSVVCRVTCLAFVASVCVVAYRLLCVSLLLSVVSLPTYVLPTVLVA